MTTTLATTDLIDESRLYEVWPSLTRLDDYTGPTVALSPEDRAALRAEATRVLAHPQADDVDALLERLATLAETGGQYIPDRPTATEPEAQPMTRYGVATLDKQGAIDHVDLVPNEATADYVVTDPANSDRSIAVAEWVDGEWQVRS